MRKSTRREIKPGDRFGRGVIIKEIRVPNSARPNGVRGARLLCDCGTIYEVSLSDIIPPASSPDKPVTKSCGCLRRDTAREHGSSQVNRDRLARLSRTPEMRAKSAAQCENRTVHGLSRHDGTQHPLYGTWVNMMTRCYNQNFLQYKDWGGRGISVCDRWHDPQVFIEDIMRLIGPRPDGMTLDRVNNNGNYEAGNVRWATWYQQARNRRPRREL